MSEHETPLSHRVSAAHILARPWRVGGSTGRAIYCWPGGDDDVIGLMDTRELSMLVVEAHNYLQAGRGDYAEACVCLNLSVDDQ